MDHQGAFLHDIVRGAVIASEPVREVVSGFQVGRKPIGNKDPSCMVLPRVSYITVVLQRGNTDGYSSKTPTAHRRPVEPRPPDTAQVLGVGRGGGIWALSGGVPRAFALDDTGNVSDPKALASTFHFVQVSDSHIALE